MSDTRLDEPPTGRRGEEVSFRFLGKVLRGYTSEPLAVALYASGFRFISRSMKLYRPRGFFCLHPQARTIWVKVNGNPVSPSEILCHEGMNVEAERSKPLTVTFASYLLDASFQHRGLVRNKVLWPLIVEKVKKLANHPELGGEEEGGGVSEVEAGLVVVGGGAAGLSAALAARRYGVDVLLIDDEDFGGKMRYDVLPLEDEHGSARRVVKELEDKARKAGVRFMGKTTFTGFFEDAATAYNSWEKRLYVVRARGYVIATGAVELPCIFKGNDLPGVISASTALRLANEYGVLPGKRGVILGATAYGMRVKEQLERLGVEVRVLDSGEVEAGGREEVEWVEVKNKGGREKIEADFVACASLINPDLKLLGQLHARIAYINGGGFVPLHSPYMEVGENSWVAGGASGAPYGYLHVLEGEIAGLSAALSLGVRDAERECEGKVKEYRRKLNEVAGWKKYVFKAYEGESVPEMRIERPPHLYLHEPSREAFICFCEDIHSEDIWKIVRKGFNVMEKVKRGVGICTGRCQGRLCMVSAALYVAHLSGKDPNHVGLTRMRPPAVPIPMAALAGGG